MLRRSSPRFGATVDDAFEIAVDAYVEAVLPDRLGQAFGDVEGIERDDAARFRPHPEDFRVSRALGHREDARRIGLQQKVRRDAVAWRIGTGHGC